MRLYSWTQEEWVGGDLFQQRVAQAIRLRRQMLKPMESRSDSLRWVNSEGDYLSGLVVDCFAGHLVVQLTAGVIEPYLEGILSKLTDELRPASISVNIDEKTAKGEGIDSQDRVVSGKVPEEAVSIWENGLAWKVDLHGGQKTGYYLDQRDNRLAAGRWTPAGGKVLDVCTYAGGFALTIAKLTADRHETCESITAVDSSAKALELAKMNALHNGLEAGIAWEQADFFDALSRRVDRSETYDQIVLDPPKLAGSRDKVPRALAAYHRLNYLAIRCLRPEGILVTCSCSGRVDRSEFLDVLLGAARRAGRDLQILENRGAASDHPVNIHCQESDYLKCIIARAL